MGDMGDYYNDLREYHKERKTNNLKNAIEKIDDGSWTKHNDYHWSKKVNNIRLDYWPSRNKFMYKNKIMIGDVLGFIKNKERK